MEPAVGSSITASIRSGIEAGAVIGSLVIVIEPPLRLVAVIVASTSGRKLPHTSSGVGTSRMPVCVLVTPSQVVTQEKVSVSSSVCTLPTRSSSGDAAEATGGTAALVWGVPGSALVDGAGGSRLRSASASTAGRSSLGSSPTRSGRSRSGMSMSEKPLNSVRIAPASAFSCSRVRFDSAWSAPLAVSIRGGYLVGSGWVGVSRVCAAALGASAAAMPASAAIMAITNLCARTEPRARPAASFIRSSPLP